MYCGQCGLECQAQEEIDREGDPTVPRGVRWIYSYWSDCCGATVYADAELTELYEGEHDV